MTEGGDRPRAATGPGNALLTLEQAADCYNFQPDRLRRRLQAGGVPGAHLDDDGTTWWIPEKSLAFLGYRPVNESQPSSAALPNGLDGLATELRRRGVGNRTRMELAEAHLEAGLAELAAGRVALEAERAGLDLDRRELAEERALLQDEREDLANERAVLETERAAWEAAIAASEARRPQRRRRAPAWVKPEDGVCPVEYPVKAKTGSEMFYMPGTDRYRSVRPDRCYGSEEAALADGFSPPPARAQKSVTRTGQNKSASLDAS